MNLKPKLVVASMSVLGLISCPAFAATHHHKHNHHHVMVTEVRHEHEETIVRHDYKDMGALPGCPLMDPNLMILDKMDQQYGRARPTEDCMKLISFAGGIAFDAGWGNRNIHNVGENDARLSLNDAYLNIFGNVNDWTKAYATLSYNSTRGEYSNAYGRSLQLEQGMIRISNFNESPIFVQLGKQFQPFGRYSIHPITRSTSQVLAESLRTSAELGFLYSGFHGELYALDGSLPHRAGTALGTHVAGHNPVNFGADLGFDQVSDILGYDLGIGYMYNMTGANDVADAVNDFNGGMGYHNRVGGLAVYGDVNSGPFSLGIHYTTALQRFSITDLATRTPVVGGGKTAKPWGADATAGYAFNAWNRSNLVYVGYQASGDSVNIELPKSRWQAGWGVDVWHNTTLALEYDHDKNYNAAHGGAGRSSNKVIARAAVRFG